VFDKVLVRYPIAAVAEELWSRNRVVMKKRLRLCRVEMSKALPPRGSNLPVLGLVWLRSRAGGF
jgi:hypothetical protein